MEFTMQETTRITGVKRDRIKEWLHPRGHIKPSIKVASGTGTRNIFSRADLYIIAVFKYLVDERSGWYRKAAGDFVEAIVQKDVEVLGALLDLYEFLPFRDLLVGRKLFQPEIFAVVDADIKSEKVEEAIDLLHREALGVLNETLDKKGTLNLYLVFSRVGRNVVAWGVAETYTESKGFERLYGARDLSRVISLADDVYLLNFKTIAHSINQRVYEIYPGKLTYEDYKENLESARKIIQAASLKS